MSRQRSTIRHAVLRASVGTRGWVLLRVMRVAAAIRASTVTHSWSARVWYTVVSWWKPSGRRGPMLRPKLILVCERTLVGIVPILVCMQTETGLVAVVPVLSLHLHHCQGGPPPLNLSSRPDPDFLPRIAGQARVCCFRYGKQHEPASATNLNRKSGGANPGFLLRCTHKRPRVRLSVRKAA